MEHVSDFRLGRSIPKEIEFGLETSTASIRPVQRRSAIDRAINH